MIYGYARVSTAKQMKDGNSLEDQITKLKEKGAQEIIQDAYTGTKLDRPNFTKLLERLQPGDTLIVTKLDRLARSAIDGGTIVRELIDKGITVHILNMGVLDNTPFNKATVTMFFAFAEFERDMIVERTQAGKAIARADGKRVDGRPKKFHPAQLDHAMQLLEEGHSFTDVEEKTGISKSTLVREKRSRKAKTMQEQG